MRVISQSEDQILSGMRSQKEILTKKNLVGAKTVCTAVARTFTHLVRATGFLSRASLPPRIRWKIDRRMGAGSNRDPESLFVRKFGRLESFL